MKMRLQEVEQGIIVILGPTAVGKTELSLQLAERLNGEIVSVDSRLFYRGMNIGTAKPSADEMARVRHHLVDVADPDEVWSLAVFQKAAYRAIDEIHARGKLPILAGGTGQYVHAVIDGWELPEQAPDDGLRDVLNAWAEAVGAEALHRKLELIDPAAAAKIEPNNVRRTVRALEVIFRTGQRFSAQRKRGYQRYPMLLIGLTRPREEIYARVDLRIEKMLADGLLDEVRVLLDAGYSPESPTMSAIGYREMIAYLQGEMTLEAATTQMKSITHQFVRRQANWFKLSDPRIRWFDMHEANLIERIICFVEETDRWIFPPQNGDD
ncbi:MAG: tRNA (adenosine(37)-N6)-dimethylallyltransferase MiaA [Anaerolineaceae bacterium]|nr:tRNA (adenosine(37)-N6)-dimethylallyltransferase MiaA [Anaerolineaceae bacterium]